MLANFVSRGVFLFNPKFRKFWLESKSNRLFWFGFARIFDNTFEGGPLWTFLLVWPKWLFPFDIIVVPATAHLYPAYKQLPKHTVAWVWGLYNSNVLFHWVCGISKISNKILFWMEPTIKLDVFGIHLLCLGLTRGFNKNNLKNIPSKALYILCLCSTRLHPKYNVSRAVIKRRVPGISPGYPKHCLWLLS